MIGKRALRAIAISGIVLIVAAACAPAATPTTAPAQPAETAAPAQPAGTAAPQPSGTQTGTQVDTSKIPEMTLKVAQQNPPTGFSSEMLQWWADEITKRTDGKVKFQFFWSNSLVKATDFVPALQQGTADIAQVASTYDPARTAIWSTLDMPYNAKDYYCGISASTDVAMNDPDLRAEFEKNGFLPLMGYSSGHFGWLTKAELNTLDDVKGKKLRLYGGAQVNWAKILGVTGIFMAYADIYEAVERGAVDGALATIFLTDTFKHYEIAKNFVKQEAGFVVAAPLASISVKKWNTFPEELKQVFIEVGKEHDMLYAKGLIEEEARLKDMFIKEKGMVFKPWSEADAKRLEEAGLQAQEEFLAEKEANGIPARRTWENFRSKVTACEADVAQNGHPWEQ